MPDASLPATTELFLLRDDATRPRARRGATVRATGLCGDAAPDRLTLAVAVYLMLPGLLFVVTWTAPWVAVLGGAAGVAALASMPGRAAPWPLGWRTGLACLLAGLLWAGGTGTHHLLYSTADWQVRDAVLRDLALLPWPVGYVEGNGRAWLLRAPLGFFLPAGLVGRVLGVPAAQGLLWAWCGLGLGLLLALIATIARAADPARPGRAFAVLALVFALFHGADIVPNLVLDARAGAGLLASWGRGGEWWDRLFQYAGHVTAMLWAPNHALPTWLVALLLVRHHRARQFAGMAALPLAAAAFWSPVGAAGAAVLTCVALARDGAWRSVLVAPGTWCAVTFALPLCLYLTAGSGTVPHATLFALHPLPVALARWAVFLAVEVLPWAVPVLLLLGRDRLLQAAIVLLCLLPLYVFGPGNEMASRGAIAPLAVLALAGGQAWLLPPAVHRPTWFALRIVAILALAGAVTEASLLVARSPWPASRDCTVMAAARQSVFDDSTDWSHYLLPWPDPVLRSLLARPILDVQPASALAPRCWPRGGP